MRLKRQLEYQTRHFLHFLFTLQLPEWLQSRQLKLGLTGAVMVMGLGYIFQTSSLSTSGYVIHEMENHVTELKVEQQKLEVAVASARSMASIQKRLPTLHLVPVTKMEHMSGTMVQTAMAK